MHRKITTKTVKLSFDIQNQHHMPTSEISCTFFCEMNKTSEYLTFENDNKKTCLIIFFFYHFTANSYNATEAKVPV